MSFLIPKQKWAFKGHESAVKRLLLTPDGKITISMGENGYLRIMDAETGQIHHMNHFPMDSHAMDLSSDGAMLALGTLSVFSLTSGTTRRIKNREERWGVVRHLIFSPDDKDIIFTDDSRFVYLWKGKEKCVVTFCEGHRGGYSSAPLFFPDGRRLVVCPCHSEMGIYHWETGQKIAEIPGFINIMAAAFSPDGTKMAVVLHGASSSVGIYDTETWEGERILDAHTEMVRQIVFSPNGKWLATCSMDRTLIIWEVQTGKVLKCFKGFRQPIESFCFSADWSRLVVSTHDSSKIRDENAFCVMDFDGPNLGEISDELEYFLRVNRS